MHGGGISKGETALRCASTRRDVWPANRLRTRHRRATVGSTVRPPRRTDRTILAHAFWKTFPKGGRRTFLEGMADRDTWRENLAINVPPTRHPSATLARGLAGYLLP